MNRTVLKSRLLIAASAVALAGLVATASPAAAHPATHGRSLHGSTSVTTGPGIVSALVGKGVLPLPIEPRTGFRLGFSGGLNATYTFPITGGDPNLTAGTGDIDHAGGIYFVGLGGAQLAIARFDIDLAAGKVFALRVNGAKAHVAILDLDLSGLKVTSKHHATVLSGIKVSLDAQAATALDATFAHLDLPAGLAFGSAVVVLKS